MADQHLSEEQPIPVRTGTAKSGELDIAYEDMGDVNDPAVLLIMGLGAQLIFWRTTNRRICQFRLQRRTICGYGIANSLYRHFSPGPRKSMNSFVSPQDANQA